jgi:hypothetical protein
MVYDVEDYGIMFRLLRHPASTSMFRLLRHPRPCSVSSATAGGADNAYLLEKMDVVFFDKFCIVL